MEDKKGSVVDSLPLYDQSDDAEKIARRRTKSARVFLVIGVALEVFATFLAFRQAVLAGALKRRTDCGFQSRLSELYSSSRAVENCDGPIEAYHLLNSTSAWGADQFGFSFEEHDFNGYVGCDSLTVAPTVEQTFLERCGCCSVHNGSYYPACSWVALSSPSNGICYAQAVLTNTSDETMIVPFSDFSARKCWPRHPSGTVKLMITAFVVALCSQFVEAFVGLKYWKDTESNSVPTLAASVLEALGVLAVSSMLFTFPGLYDVSEYMFQRLPTFFNLAWVTVVIVIVGALAEILAECSERAVGRFPYLGSVGNGLVWLGAALLEMVITTYLLWAGEGARDVTALVREAAGLFAAELLGLVAMWIARGLWTSAKLLRSSIKRLKG